MQPHCGINTDNINIDDTFIEVSVVVVAVVVCVRACVSTTFSTRALLHVFLAIR
jgi:hypothetical protein